MKRLHISKEVYKVFQSCYVIYDVPFNYHPHTFLKSQRLAACPASLYQSPLCTACPALPGTAWSTHFLTPAWYLEGLSGDRRTWLPAPRGKVIGHPEERGSRHPVRSPMGSGSGSHV